MQLTEAKRDYYSTKIEASNNDQKSLFYITKKLLVNQQAATVPTHETNFELAIGSANSLPIKIEVSEYVKILEVTFDNRMTLQKHKQHQKTSKTLL